VVNSREEIQVKVQWVLALGNEKGAGSGIWPLLEDGFELW
jgi:hypothetical protein